MSLIGFQISEACTGNNDLVCASLRSVGSIVFALFTLAIPFIVLETLKQNWFKNSDWTQKLATLSGYASISVFCLMSAALVFDKSLNETLDVGYAFVPLVGAIPYVIKHLEDIRKMYREAEMKNK